jgi:outer membrane receptor protein involved in Fe transport
MGIEAEFAAHYNKFKSFLNFSYNKPGNQTSDGFLTADKKYFLGMPIYKINLGGYKEFKKLVIGPTFTFLSKRYGESQNHAQGLTTGYESISYDPILLTNLSITYKGLSKKIDINLSAYNLFDQKYLLIQPYYGAHAPLPANDRQITIGAKLNL